jgi:hypothetical protein
MLKKTLLTISIVLPLAAISATAQAGSTITDKSYWPNEASRPFAFYPQDRVSSAFAYDRGVVTPVPDAVEVRPAWRYQRAPQYR